MGGGRLETGETRATERGRRPQKQGGSLDGGASLSLSVTTGRLLAEQIDGEGAQEPQHRGLRNEGTTTGGHSEYGQLSRSLGGTEKVEQYLL